MSFTASQPNELVSGSINFTKPPTLTSHCRPRSQMLLPLCAGPARPPRTPPRLPGHYHVPLLAILPSHTPQSPPCRGPAPREQQLDGQNLWPKSASSQQLSSHPQAHPARPMAQRVRHASRLLRGEVSHCKWVSCCGAHRVFAQSTVAHGPVAVNHVVLRRVLRHEHGAE
jgi:hypothetical protein